MKNVSDAVKRETKYIAVWVVILSIIMQVIFIIAGHWDYTVLLGNVLSGTAAVLNFFLMGMTVQSAVDKEEKAARAQIRASQSMRTLMLFAVAAALVLVPFFNTWASIIALFFPRVAIAIRPVIQKQGGGRSMKNKSRLFVAVDMFYIAMMIVPILTGIIIKILTTAPLDGISITGAQIYFEIPMPVQNLVITESQINSWLVIIAILGLCLYLTHGLSVRADLKRQHFAEWIVETVDRLTTGNMGEYFAFFSPFIASILALSAFSSLLSLFGLYAPTSDINVTAGWAILVFALITYYKLKCGPVQYVKDLCDPVLLAPLNIIGEVATPVSMAFRHYGNVLSGGVISVLVATGLQGLSVIVLGWLPGFSGEFPLLQIGIPAVLSVYFDVFSGCLQAYIFAMLTMLYVSGGFNIDLYFEKKRLKKKNI